MFDWIAAIPGFFAGLLSSYFVLIGLFFFAILSERMERIGWGIFFGILMALSIYFAFGLSALSGLGWPTLVAAYVVGGIVHSLWRWFRSTAIITDKFNAEVEHYDDTSKIPQHVIRNYKDDTNFRENMDKITYWVVAWPVSGAAHLFGDAVIVVQEAVTRFFSGIFDKITERARGKASIDVSKL